MAKQSGSIQRVGRIYRFSANGTEYAAFIWQMGAQFRGRVEGQPQIPLHSGRTAMAVLEAIQQTIAADTSA